MTLRAVLLFAIGLGLAAPAHAESCAEEAAQVLRPALLKAVLNEYPGRADAALQLELALTMARAMYSRGNCPRSLANLRWTPEGELDPLARVIVGLQKVGQDVEQIGREVHRRTGVKP